MVESNQRSIEVEKDIKTSFDIIQKNAGEFWDLLFKNLSDDQGELVYLCGDFSGGGYLAFRQGARRSLVFIKLFKRGERTKILVVTGGSVDIFGLDYGRFEDIINEVLAPFEGTSDKIKEWPKY